MAIALQPGEKSPEEIAMEASLKASLASKYDLTAEPDPMANAQALNPGMFKAPEVVAESKAVVVDGKPEVKGTPAETKKDPTVEMLLERIAAMESKWETERKGFEERLAQRDVRVELPQPKVEAPPPSPSWVTKEDFLKDPAGIFAKEGIPFDFVAASLVVAELRKQGVQPDAALLAKVNQYPALASVTSSMTTSMEQMAARLAAIEEERQNEKYEAGLIAAAATVDKTKFPQVAEAKGRDALAVEAKLKSIVMMDAAGKPKTAPRMTPEQAMQRLEDDFALAKRLLALTPNSPQGVPGDTSTKTPPATAANLGGAPVATPATTPEEADRQLKEMIVNKYEPRRQAGF